ncbi:UPF0481 protein [Vigna angularis]|uniref:UPF0481 protein n=1 Tax=Phaseolus angularis TaxID=3914 RepID=A0A8T0KHA7_PHAAN|nr:UPF0481 protein [Vigna angularis]
MASAKLVRLANHMSSTRKIHSTAKRMSSNWRDHMKKELENGHSGKQEQSHHPVCIYRVPYNMRKVEPKAYRPNNISIGPCHHGAPHLRNMEALKKRFYISLFNNDANAAKLDQAFEFLEEQETNVRRCYNEDIKLSSDEFLQMMLVDGSFIVQLLRDLSANEFGKVRSLSPWMLPIIRREMIMLENQLPMFVLSKLFELTSVDSAPSGHNNCLQDLALRFFYPLLQVDSDYTLDTKKAGELRGLHFLDLLSWVVGVSTVGALLALYFTFIQTVCSFADSIEAFKNQSFRSAFIDVFCIPVRGVPTNDKRKSEICTRKFVVALNEIALSVIA